MLAAEAALRAAEAEEAEEAPRSRGARPPPASRGALRSTARTGSLHSADGHPIWVGRAGADNDALTFQVARPHHLWLHARGLPGAHVVVPLDRKEEIPPEVLLDAAHLALHHARGAGSNRGEVAWTRARLVRG